MKTILIADDEQDILEVLNFILEARGYQVVTAANGKDAYALLESQQIDLIISDYMMPVMNGLELHARIQANPDYRCIPFILISAFPNEMSNERIQVLPKPFDIDHLVTEVTKALQASPSVAMAGQANCPDMAV